MGAYLFSVKDNQQILKETIEGYVKDKHLQKTMNTHTTIEKTSSRIEKRTGYTSEDIGRLSGKEEWAKLACIGAVNTHSTGKKGETNEWHYYISSRSLKAEELLKHARLEWSVETMRDVKISGSFRLWDGTLYFCRIRGYLSTCKKHTISSADALKTDHVRKTV